MKRHQSTLQCKILTKTLSISKHITIHFVFSVLLGIAFISFTNRLSAQSGCTSNVPTYTIDFTGNNAGGSFTTPLVTRAGNCCGTTSPDRCLHFIITVDSNTAAVNFQITSGAIPPGAIFYQLDCGTQTQVGNATCITSGTNHDLTFCKPGNNTNAYTVYSIPKPRFPKDDTVRVGCSKVLTVIGLVDSTISWNSIYPGSAGAYNSYLSCFSKCTGPSFNPVTGAPAYVDYVVCGTPAAIGCGLPTTVCDTVRLYVYPELKASISPAPATYCVTSSGVTLTANVSGGLAPFTYIWKDGAGATVSTASTYFADTGAYTVTVSDKLSQVCSNTTALTTVTISNVTVLSSHTNVSCNGGSDGTVAVSVTGGALPYTYLWQGGQTTSSVTGLVAGTYSVTVSDLGGCAKASSVTISEPPVLTVVIDSTHNVTCNGNQNGAIYISVSGGTPVYTYLWTPGGSTEEDISALDAGTYSVTVTDLNGCKVNATTTITEPSTIVPLFSAVGEAFNLNCKNDSSGRALVDTTLLGGTSPYSLLWSNGATSSSVTGLYAGNITVVITDGNGCTADTVFTITEPDSIRSHFDGFSTYFGGANISCHGASDGSVDLAVDGGGTPGYSFSWNGGAYTTEDLTNVPAGNYIVFITDTNGCMAVDSIFLTEPDSLIASITSPLYPGGYNISCKGANNGKIFTDVSGGTPFYSFNWTTPSGLPGDSDLIKLYAGFYALTVTDINGCIGLDTITLTEPDTLLPLITAISINGVNLRCFNDSSGLAYVDTVFGGTAPFSFIWDEFIFSDTLSNAVSGVHTVLITDQNGCQFDSTVTLTEPAPIFTNVSASQYGSYQVSCHNACDGIITVDTVIGGVGPYTYSWSQGSTTSSITALCEGQYQVIITDANGCLDSSLNVMDAPDSLILTATASNVLCNATNTGSIDLNMSGGTGNYTYLWSPSGNAASSETDLTVGTYCVHIEDDNFCALDTCFTLTEPPVFKIDSVISPVYPGGWNISCNAGVNGSIYSYASGGTVPYSYYWSNGDSTQNTFNVSVSTYYITATDTNGCVAIDSITLTEPALITTTVQTQVDVACYGDSSGSVTLSSTGGTAPYQYSLDGITFTSSNTFYNFKAGSYTIFTADTNGCMDSMQVTIAQPAAALSASVSSKTNVDCFGNATGSITVAASGGTSPYRFSKDGFTFQSGSTFASLAAGTFTITVVDTNGCMVQLTDTITEPAAALATTVSTTNVACFNGSSGNAVVTPSGGTPGYVYNWSNGSTTQNLGALSVGTYTLTVSDTNGCSVVDSAVITQPAQVIVMHALSDINGSNVTCNGLSDGYYHLTVSGGIAPYTYAWSNGATTQDLDNIGVGTYSVTVTDTNGCAVIDSATLVAAPSILTSISASSNGGFNISCNGGNNGSINLTVTGGTSPYTYTWSPGSASTEDISSLIAGQYNITVTDTNGCVALDSVALTEPPSISIAGAATDVLCNGGNTGAVNITVSGGVSAYGYAWSNGATTQNIFSLDSGSYEVVVTDANGCRDSSTFAVNQPASLSGAITVSQLSNNYNVCYGDSGGYATVSVSGGSGTYTYQWSNNVNTPTDSGLAAGTYSVVVTDTNNCVFIDSVTLIQAPPVGVNAGQSQQVCGNSATLSGTLSGGQVGTWTVVSGLGSVNNPNSPAATVSDLMYNPGVNVLQWTIIDSSGCRGADTVSIEAFVAVTSAAGSGDSLCTDSAFAAQLSAEQPSLGTGLWSSLGAATVTSPASTSSAVSGLTAGNNLFVWYITKGPCSASDTVNIYIKGQEQCFLDLEMPTGFTPNSDGHNDDFDIHGIELYPNNTLMIFNRWGNEVYLADDYINHQWKGQNTSGDQLPDGTYFAVLVIKNSTIKLHGYVDIRR